MEMSLGARIRAARETKKLTIDEVARALGRPLSWLSNLETGRTKNLPEPYQFRQLAALLDVPVPTLLEAAGYLQPSDRAENHANPFERSDPRWHYVETLKRFDLSRPEHAGILVAVAQLMQLLDAPPETFSLMRAVVLGKVDESTIDDERASLQ